MLMNINPEIKTKGKIAKEFNPTDNYLSNPCDKAFKKLWKGSKEEVSFGPYKSKLMIRGNANGVPICYLKGGPGSAPLSSGQKKYWDPSIMRVALSSWRACGDTTSLGGIENNTTDDLVEDIETIRKKMDVPAMLLAGHCWGSTVAFKYAACYPEKTLGILSMLPYLARKKDINQSFGPDGIAKKYPEAYQKFAGANKNVNIMDVFKRYAKNLAIDFRTPCQSDSSAVNAYVNWLNWEYASSGETGTLKAEDINLSDKQTIWGMAGERVNISYVMNNYYLPDDGITGDLDAVNKLAQQGKPIMYVANEFDPLSAPSALKTLKQKLPDAQSIVLKNVDWHWLAAAPREALKSNYNAENAFAFMVRKASSQLMKLSF